jgi:hypothetical protein
MSRAYSVSGLLYPIIGFSVIGAAYVFDSGPPSLQPMPSLGGTLIEPHATRSYRFEKSDLPPGCAEVRKLDFFIQGQELGVTLASNAGSVASANYVPLYPDSVVGKLHAVLDIPGGLPDQIVISITNPQSQAAVISYGPGSLDAVQLVANANGCSASLEGRRLSP